MDAVVAPPNLPAQIEGGLADFLSAAKRAFGDGLRSAVLYGSAAEGKLRATSDVNLLLVLSEFSRGKADEMREPMSVARAAINLRVMFLLQTEIADAFEGFAQKFAEIQLRHRVLYGEDPFTGFTASRQDQLRQMRQSLLNQVLRLRASYVGQGLREEQLALLAAEAAGPLRASARLLLVLEGKPPVPPKAALEQIAAPDPAALQAVQRVSQARQKRFLPPGEAGPTVFELIELAVKMHARAKGLS
jgi:predicted nucleotidyltransferase